jgi:hypothetical protein
MTALLDTVLALLAPNDAAHDSCLQAMATERNPLLPTPVLPELAYMTIRNVGRNEFSTVRFALEQ